jgi:hypothetical protein
VNSFAHGVQSHETDTYGKDTSPAAAFSYLWPMPEDD